MSKEKETNAVTKRADVKLPDGRTALKVDKGQAGKLGAGREALDAVFGGGSGKRPSKSKDTSKEVKTDA